MAISNPQPPVIDGITYPLLGVSLAMSTIPRDGAMALSIAVTFAPYRDSEQGPQMLDEGKSVLVYGDALQAAQSDPHLAQFLGTLEAAAQRFINARV